MEQARTREEGKRLLRDQNTASGSLQRVGSLEKITRFWGCEWAMFLVGSDVRRDLVAAESPEGTEGQNNMNS